MSIANHDSFSASLFCSSLSVSCLILGDISLRRESWGECLLLFKTKPPLRLRGATITENSTTVWTSSNLASVFEFLQEKMMKSLIFSPQWYSTLKMHFSECWLKSRAQDLKIKLLWTAKLSCEPLGAKPVVFFLILPQRTRRAGGACYTAPAASGHNHVLP